MMKIINDPMMTYEHNGLLAYYLVVRSHHNYPLTTEEVQLTIVRIAQVYFKQLHMYVIPLFLVHKSKDRGNTTGSDHNDLCLKTP